MKRLKPGVPNFDVDMEWWYFHCDGETLAAKLTQEFGLSIVGRGIGPQSAISSQTTLRILRCEGCQWCAILPVHDSSGWNTFANDANLMPRLSKRLNIDALFLGISDTAGAAMYRYYRAGQSIEEISFDSEGDGEYDPQSDKPGYEDIDRKVRELGIILMFLTPLDEIGSPIRPLSEIDCNADQIAEALILQKKAGDEPLETTARNAREKPSPKQDQLLRAILNSDMEAVSAAIAAGADVNAPTNRDDKSYLLLAVERAAYHDNDEIADLLLAAGADPNLAGTTPILPFLAEMDLTVGYLRWMAKLLDAGADVNARVESKGFLPGGQTALMESSIHAKLNQIKLLLKYGADPTIKDEDGKTALDHATNWLQKVKEDRLKKVPKFTHEASEPTAQSVVDLLAAARVGRLDVASLPDINQLIEAEKNRLTEERRREEEY